ncbi:MAG: hypothetical protein EBE86_028830 [Hormoscilla sp. GUM202]|nr:hypothetical protein [Hormoscilla sp. GUM202]
MSQFPFYPLVRWGSTLMRSLREKSAPGHVPEDGISDRQLPYWVKELPRARKEILPFNLPFCPDRRQ